MTEIEIHTSDRELFKRCRRKWAWASRVRGNLVVAEEERGAPWLGSGVHFALEDFHGYNKFQDPRLAFAAYVKAHKQNELPQEWEDLASLGIGMLDYYTNHWLKVHPEPYKTLWIKGVPQVEVEVRVDITSLVKEEWAIQNRNYKLPRDLELIYVTTYDRVVVDRHKRLLGVDYKTAKQFDALNLSTNPQAAAYDWSLDIFYEGWDIEGIVWQQHYKGVPEAPEELLRPKKMPDGRLAVFSIAEKQQTTHTMYRQALLDYYGDIPDYYTEFLNKLAENQTPEGDRYIRRDIIQKNPAQRVAEQAKIVQEAVDMLDPNLPLYPNPTRDCSWDCPFKGPCLATDDGSDPSFMIKSEFVQWEGYRDDWRGRIQWPVAA